MIYFCYKQYFALTWLGVAGADQCAPHGRVQRAEGLLGEGWAGEAS